MVFRQVVALKKLGYDPSLDSRLCRALQKSKEDVCASTKTPQSKSHSTITKKKVLQAIDAIYVSCFPLLLS